jgi:hypothetical protein
VSRRRGAFTSTQLVEMSTGLPGVVLKESDTWTNITFKGMGFAWVNHTENRAMIKAHRDERDALLATSPEIYEAGWATNSSAWVKVRLELADPEEVYELLEEGWRMTATKKIVKAFDESRGV